MQSGPPPDAHQCIVAASLAETLDEVIDRLMVCGQGEC
jgi:hypothetical protein